SFSSPRTRAALISRTRSGAATSCCSAAKRRASPRRCTQPPTRGSSFRCEKACARSTWRWPPPWRWGERCGKTRRLPHNRSGIEGEIREPKKYEAGEGHLTPLGATPHPRRSLALCRSLPPVKVPHTSGGGHRTPNIPHAGRVPRNNGKKKLRLEFSPAQTMAKKSLAEIFLYPKTLRVCRLYDSRPVSDSKRLCERAQRVATANPPTSARWHRMSDGDGRPAMS